MEKGKINEKVVENGRCGVTGMEKNPKDRMYEKVDEFRCDMNDNPRSLYK